MITALKAGQIIDPQPRLTSLLATDMRHAGVWVEGATLRHELRDPYFFGDIDGSAYLYYTGSGERAIGVAAVRPP